MDSSGIDTWVRDSGMPFMNLRGMFFAHFVLIAFAMSAWWSPSAYLFYNTIFMMLLVWGIIEKDKSHHLELAMYIDGMAVVLDIFCLASFFPDATVGKFSGAMGIFNLLLRFISVLVIRQEVKTRTDVIIGGSFGGQYQDIDGGDQ